MVVGIDVLRYLDVVVGFSVVMLLATSLAAQLAAVPAPAANPNTPESEMGDVKAHDAKG